MDGEPARGPETRPGLFSPPSRGHSLLNAVPRAMARKQTWSLFPAGAAALARQYLREGREGGGFPLSAPMRDPSSALVRALLIASARSLAGGPQTTVIEQPAPSPEQGWGRLVLAGALPLRGAGASLVVLQDDDVSSSADGFPSGAMTPAVFGVQVLPSMPGVPLTVALAFTDALPTPVASSPVVNDLDLEVESPSGDVYRGNVFASGWSVTGGVADSLNAIELVRVPPPVAAGTWIVRVRPTSVLIGPQPFALVAIGRACRPIGAFATRPVAAEVECGDVAVSAPSVGGTPPVTYAIFGADTPAGEDFSRPIAAGLSRAATIDRPASSQRWYVVEAQDACGATVRSAEAVVQLSSPCDAASPPLRVTRTPTDAVLTWGDVGVMHEVVRYPVVSAVQDAPPIATTSTGGYAEPMPPDALAFYLVR